MNATVLLDAGKRIAQIRTKVISLFFSFFFFFAGSVQGNFKSGAGSQFTSASRPVREEKPYLLSQSLVQTRHVY